MSILRNGNQKLVRESTGFANVLDFELAPLRDPRPGLSEADLIGCFESAHKAEGRDPRNDSDGQCIEDPDTADEIWESQYAEDAAEIIRKFAVS